MFNLFQVEVNPRRKNSKVNIKCIICKTSFPEPLFNAHQCSGAKPFECNICEKTFTQKNTLANHKRTHTGEKPYSCDVCQKSYSQSSGLSAHNKTVAHIERMKSKNTNRPLIPSSFVDCGESIKVEDIKEEINEEESVDDPLSIHEWERRSKSDYVVTGVKEEVIGDDPLCVQEIHNFRDEENNKVADDIDIV